MPWPLGREKFRSYFVRDSHDMSIIATEFEEKPLMLSIGTPQSRKTHAGLAVSKENASMSRDVNKDDFHWEHLIDPSVLPNFVPLDRAKELMMGTVALASGSLSPVQNSGNPILYTGKDMVESALSEKRYSRGLLNQAVNLSAHFFVKNVETSLVYDEIETSSPDNIRWFGVFSFSNLSNLSTIITKAELLDKTGTILSINDNLKIELPINSTLKTSISFRLNTILTTEDLLSCRVNFKHSQGTLTFNYNTTSI